MVPIIFWMITNTENRHDQTGVGNVDQEWKGFSVFLHVFLPVAGMALLWGQRGIFAKMLLQLDRRCVAVYCPSLSKREKLLKWAGDRLPPTWSSQSRTLSSGIPELWKDGSLLCTLINSVVPGACSNPHRHWRKPPLHAQALAYKYLELVPVFTEDDLSGEFTINQERNFIHYLQQLQEAINKWPTKDEVSRNFSSQYVARGMGLSTGEQHRKTVFYVYSSAKKRSNILMYIRGPYGTYGKATISPFHNVKTIPVLNVLHDQLEAAKLSPFKGDQHNSFLKTISLDFTSLIGGADGKAVNDEIPIQIDVESDRTKITYIPNNSGIYEINLICDGEMLRGSPYLVQIVKNTSFQKDCFNPKVESVENKITITKRKILSTVIDCVDEKICIENDKVAKVLKDNKDSSIETKSDDLTITAVTKQKDEIMKTEISCSLEDIIEESVDRGVLTEMKNIGETLESDPPSDTLGLQLDSKHKTVRNCLEARNEIVNLFQPQKNVDQVDHPDDENNNSASNRIKSKISLEISPKPLKKFSRSVDSLSSTSPICTDHIDPEVETRSLTQLTLSEKRKTLSKQDSINLSEPDITFSPLENDDSSKLSVLNVLNTLRQSRKNSLSETYSLTSTVSLPNMTELESNGEDDISFSTRRNYWEQMSSRSSSGVSLANSDYSQPRKRVTTIKNIFNKHSLHESNVKLADNVSACDDETSKCIDASLEDCTIIPLEERKKQLLKNMYELEKRTPKKLNFTIICLKKIKSEDNNISLSPISDRVQSFDKNIKEETKTSEMVEDTKPTKNMFKTQFRRAIHFFKNLEEGNKEKKIVVKRRHSLNFEKKTKERVKGGSLNLPHVSERFSLNNLYADVFGGRNGSFKGAPNKRGVVESLASFPKNKAPSNLKSDDENIIRFNLFLNKGKSKKRKSINSIFEVNY